MEIVIPFADLIDVDAAVAQLTRQIEKLQRDLEGVQGKLADERFVGRAPHEVVEKMRRREFETREALQTLIAQRTQLAGTGDG
jgi:valyl-tRNA synthetase